MTLSGAGIEAAVAIGPRENLFRKLLRDPLGGASLVVLAVVICIGIVAPWIEPHNPNAGSLQLVNSAPGGDYLLGGDGSGRDILSRLVSATRVTLLSALTGTVVAVIVGVTSGLLAGFYGRTVDVVTSWSANVLRAVPAIIILIAVYAAVGPSTQVAMVVFGVLISPGLFRLVRSLVMAVKGELYIDAARVAGLSDARIIARHVFYAVRAPIIIQAAFIAGVTISIQAGLDFLGLGDPNEASWGSMLQDAFTNLYIAPLELLWPGLTLALTISALVLLGNSLRDALEGGTRRRGSRRPGGVRLEEKHAGPSKTRSRPKRQVSDQNITGDHGSPLLQISDLSIGYPGEGVGDVKEVVHNASLRVRAGEIVGLVGESGSGKSQLAFSALGLLPDTAMIMHGSVRVGGQEIQGLADAQLRRIRGRKVGYVPQEPMSNLDPSFRIGTQLVYGVRAVSQSSWREAKREVLELLERVGLHDPNRVFDSYPHQLSGGMAQRVLIAGAISGRPQLLIADEPTTALDVTVQAEILELLRDLQQERQMGVLIVTHNFGVVADLCDRVAVMHDGRIVEEGTTSALFTHPQNSYTQQLLGAILPEGTGRRQPVPMMQGVPPHE